jgi:4-amino-4-deoxy-L-arabinose transferase-like glycosyltransferase
MDSLTAERPAPFGADPLVHDAESRYAQERAPGIALNVELIAWCLVLLAAAALRLLDLSALPLGPADGPRARAALELTRGTTTPEWGGDLTSGLTALVFRLFGDSDATARVGAALCGVAAVAVLALYRPLMGRGAALVAALLLAISPVAVGTARSLSPEAAALPLALVLPPLAGRLFLRGRLGAAPPLMLVLGIGLGTGALVPGVALVTLLWLAVEPAWLDDPAPADVGRELIRRPRLLLICALALLPGLLLAFDRYGAGWERLTLSAFGAWSGPPAEASAPRAWWYLPVVLFAYEPLALALGAAGAVLVAARWQCAGAGPRLAAVWGLAGGLMALLWLQRDPAQLLLLTVPLALLSGYATARGAGAVAASLGGRGWLALAPLLPAFGYTVLILARWANSGVIFVDELFSVIVVLAGVAAATAGAIALLRRPLPGYALLLAWVVLAPATLHAASNVAFRGGPELLTGVRSLPEAEAVVRRLDEGAEPGLPVQVERRLWPFLAWPLRGRPAYVFVAKPPFVPAVLPAAADAAADPRNAIPVGEYWSPASPDLSGWTAWWLMRSPWRVPRPVRAELLFE